MTRHELKEQLQHDQFTDAVSRVITYTTENRQRVTRVAVVAAVILAIAGGLWWYFSYQNSLRERDLQAAFTVLDAQVGPSNDFVKNFPTQEAKTQASLKALSDLVAKYDGTHQGLIAQYYLGTLKAQQGDAKGAEADLTRVADSGSDCNSLAKVALAQLYMGQGRTADARKLLQSVIDKPGDLISKGQAQIMLAQLEQTSNPKAAKALLQSLTAPSQPPAISRAASQVESQLSQ